RLDPTPISNSRLPGGAGSVAGKPLPSGLFLSWARHARLHRSDAIRTAAAPGNDMFRALDHDVRPKHRPEKLEFGSAESLASARRRTDRTVVLDQQEGPFPGRLELGHIPFRRSDSGQLPKL